MKQHGFMGFTNDSLQGKFIIEPLLKDTVERRLSERRSSIIND